MSVRYKLTYFNSRGRAEVARLLFAAAGIKYEDRRLTPEEVKAEKEAFTYGQLPVLEEDGKMLAQSNAIARYLARKFDLLGADDFQSALVDATYEEINDFMLKLMQAFFVKDEEKAEKLKEVFDVHLPNYFGKLEKQAANNKLEKQAANESTGFLVGDKISLADIGLLFAWDYVKDKVDEEKRKTFPNVMKVIDNAGNNPGIKAWVDTRPKTQF